MKLNWLKLGLVLIFVSNVSANAALHDSATRILSLKESLRLAVERDVRMILSQERVNQALAKIGQSRSVLLPQIEVAASQRRQTRDLRSSGIGFSGDPLVGPFNTFDGRVQLTQTIFDPSAMSRLKAAQAGQELSAAELRKTKEDVLALVAVLYIDARRSAQSVEFMKTLIDREEKRLNVTKNRLEIGTSSDLELKQSQAGYDSALRLWQQAIVNANDARLDLLAALGLDLEESVQFTEEDGLELPVPAKDVSQKDLEQLPDFQAAKQQLSVSKLNQTAERAQYFPKISALADYGKSGVTPDDSNKTYTLGLQASLPIFDGGLRKSRVKEAESQVKASEASLNDTKRQVQTNIVKAQEAFNQAQLLVTESVSRRAVARQQLNLAQGRLKDGTATDIELLEAAAQEAQAHDDENEAHANLLTAKINWIHALGKMEDILKE